MKLLAMTALTHLDVESSKFAKTSARRLAWYAGCGVFAWLLFSTHSAADLTGEIQFVCTVGALISIGRAFGTGARLDDHTLTYWDEGLLMNLIAVGMHLVRHFVT